MKKSSRFTWKEKQVIIEPSNIKIPKVLKEWDPKKGSRCLYCVHYNHKKIVTCKAFPEGIPHEILSSEFNHIYGHPNDNGIQFELDKKAIERWGL